MSTPKTGAPATSSPPTVTGSSQSTGSTSSFSSKPSSSSSHVPTNTELSPRPASPKPASGQPPKSVSSSLDDEIKQNRANLAKTQQTGASQGAQDAGVIANVRQRISEQSDKFELKYTDKELGEITDLGKKLGMSDREVENLIYAGSRNAKRIDAPELKQQMENYANIVTKRGYPYRFESKEQFQAFSKDLLQGLKAKGFPNNDVRIQGSSLRKPTAGDVDVSILANKNDFANALIKNYDNKLTTKADGKKISLQGKSFDELSALADDIKNNKTKYNSQASTFQNAIHTGIMHSTGTGNRAIKDVVKDMQKNYPDLNIESLSLVLKGGKFDVPPDMHVK
ncbi:hypothetical protein [Vitiosangium sp. GDMCC 1.1324]|uniref:hypothetical protein n=1 Tax=Vitiosangium sp. (strain GDMCC 1.1324) TaxID=2138576 RepID=UPI0011B51CB5|nr:hypothetical protein [Vitiosangium sp. GDMCC 1.1324]